MPGVALFVDHENIFIGLKEMLGLRSPDRADPAAKAAYQAQNHALTATLASGLRREAEKLGPLRLAYAVANFQQFDFFHHPGIYAQCGIDPRYNLAGRNSADTFLTNLVSEVVADPRYADLDTYILVTGDGGYFYVVKRLLDEQRQVKVWGVSGHTSHLIEGFNGIALSVEYVDRLVDFTPIKLAASAGYKSLRPEQPARSYPTPGAGYGVGAARSEPGPMPSMSQMSVAAANTPARGTPPLSDLQIVAATFDEFLAAQRLDFLSPRLFLDFLEKHRLGGPDDGTRNRYMGEALQIGVLREDKVWLGDREGLRILLNPENDVVTRYHAVRNNLFGPALNKPLHPTDSFRPKRSFIVSTILRASPNLETDEVHRWLDWFVSRGALISTYERLPRDMQAANILKMNPDHPMVQSVLAEAVWERIATPLLVLSVDTLLNTPKRPWVALSLLLRHIGDLLPVSREDLRVAIGKALERGVLVKREYPNPRRNEPTSGVHLGESSEVAELQALAREFIRRAVELSRPSGQVPISFLIQQSATAGLCGGDYDKVKDWITILEKAGLLLLRGVAHPALPGQTMTVVSPDGARCRIFLGPEAELIASEPAPEPVPEPVPESATEVAEAVAEIPLEPEP